MLIGSNSCTTKEYTNIEALNELFFGPQMFGGLAIMVWNKLYKAEFVKKFSFMEGYINEDLEFTPRIFYYANKIVKYEKDIYVYNIHLGTDSTSGMKRSVLKIDSSIEARKRLKLFFDNVACEEKIMTRINGMYYGSLINGYYEYWMLNKETNDCKKKLDELKNTIKEDKADVMCFYPGWKTKLFFISPSIYCKMVNMYRTLKK